MADTQSTLHSSPSLLDYATLLVGQRRTLVLVPLGAAVLTAVGSFLLPTSWAASASFVQATAPGPAYTSGLGAIAGQLGISLGSGSGDAPQFYAELARSRELRDSLLLTRFARPDGGQDSAPLLDLLEVEGPTGVARLEEGRLELGKLTAASVDRQTGIVKVTAIARDPALAAAIANRIIRLIDDFNLKKRNTQAGERRRFVETRLTIAEQDLRAAEDGLRRFLSANRQYDAPQLQFEYGRLQRQVQVTQEVYLTLRREYETARIQEVNDTPALSVIDSATAPFARARPERARMTLVALLLGIVTALAWVLATAFVRGLSERDAAAWSRLREAWRSATARLWRARGPAT